MAPPFPCVGDLIAAEGSFASYVTGGSTCLFWLCTNPWTLFYQFKQVCHLTGSSKMPVSASYIFNMFRPKGRFISSCYTFFPSLQVSLFVIFLIFQSNLVWSFKPFSNSFFFLALAFVASHEAWELQLDKILALENYSLRYLKNCFKLLEFNSTI